MTDISPPSEVLLENIHQANRQAKMLFASMGSSLIAYLVVSRFLPETPPMAGAGVIRVVILAVAGVAIFSATVVKGMFLRAAPPTPIARLARLRTAAVMSAAFAELPAVLGCVLFFFTGQRPEFYGLLVVSAYMLVRHFPQRDAWELYVRRGGDSR
jgi:hypothetical protein